MSLFVDTSVWSLAFRRLPFLNETQKRNILGANAAQLFGLDLKPVKKIP